MVTIDETLISERLDRYLTTKLPHISRGGIQRLMREGCILVNGKPAKPTQHPVAGQTVKITWPVPREIEAKSENIPIEVLYEDDDLVVVNKPANMPTHPGHGHESGTLVNALLHHCAGSLSGIGGVVRPGIVHRLDMDTTGCLVAAKNDAAHISLAAQLKERGVAKRYHAIVCGWLANEAGEIDAPIARHPVQRKLMTVQPGASRDARTGWRVSSAWPTARLSKRRCTPGARTRFACTSSILVFRWPETRFTAKRRRRNWLAIPACAPTGRCSTRNHWRSRIRETESDWK